MFIAVFRDRNARDVLHREEWPTLIGCPRVVDGGDVGMVHQCERLLLGLEPGNHLLRVHAPLDQLHRYFAADRLFLIGFVHDTHSPFADLTQDAVRADALGGGCGSPGRANHGGCLEELEVPTRRAVFCTRGEQGFHLFSQVRIHVRKEIQVVRSPDRLPLQSGVEKTPHLLRTLAGHRFDFSARATSRLSSQFYPPARNTFNRRIETLNRLVLRPG